MPAVAYHRLHYLLHQTLIAKPSTKKKAAASSKNLHGRLDDEDKKEEKRNRQPTTNSLPPSLAIHSIPFLLWRRRRHRSCFSRVRRCCHSSCAWCWRTNWSRQRSRTRIETLHPILAMLLSPVYSLDPTRALFLSLPVCLCLTVTTPRKPRSLLISLPLISISCWSVLVVAECLWQWCCWTTIDGSILQRWR